MNDTGTTVERTVTLTELAYCSGTSRTVIRELLEHDLLAPVGTDVNYDVRGARALSIAADASRFLDSAWSDLRAVALDNEMRSRREARIAADREAYRAASDVAAGEWSGPGAHPGRILAMLRAALPEPVDASEAAATVADRSMKSVRCLSSIVIAVPTSARPSP